MSIVTALSQELCQDEETIEVFIRKASHKYKVYKIPKRTHGHRIIAQPTKELKKYQTSAILVLERKYSSSFIPHDCATAYRKGVSIKENAQRHANNPYLLKMDFVDFFNSIVPSIYWKVFEEKLQEKVSEAERKLYEQLFFWCPNRLFDSKLMLSIGAPSSPAISNFCMYYFDEALVQYCNEKKITYTRYADDLTFSTNIKGLLFDIPNQVQVELDRNFDNRIAINHKKTVFSSKAHNRHVTGITISNEGALSLGRKRKRYIKHLVYQFQSENLDKEDCMHLKGLINFANHIEPTFVKMLIKKYGYQTLAAIQREEDA